MGVQSPPETESSLTYHIGSHEAQPKQRLWRRKKLRPAPGDKDKPDCQTCFYLHFNGRAVGSAIPKKLRKLHGMLRRLAADRSARTSGRAGKTMPVQRRTSLFDLQRAAAASVPGIHLRVVDRLESAA
jgi:hypothetical protein